MMDYATRSASCHPIRCLANSYSQQNARDSLKGLQRYKRGKNVDRIPGSARVSRAGFGVSPKRSLKVRETGTVRQHARRVRYPAACAPPEQLECAGPI